MTRKLSIAEFTARALIVVALLALAALVWRVATIFVLAFGGVILAVVLRSVMRLVRRVVRLRERWALLVAILALIVAVGLIGLAIGSRVATQLGQLTQTLPQAWQRARTMVEQTAPLRGVVHSLASQNAVSGWLSRLKDVATVTIGALVDAGVILFSGLYFAADPQVYRRGLLHLIPAAAQGSVERAIDAAVASLGHWLKGVLLSMISIGVVTGIGLWVIGMPLALALGILAGLFEFIPYVGPILWLIPTVLVALTLGPGKVLEVLVLYVIVHVFEGELLVPMIQKWAVALPPAMGIIAVVVFGWLFGLLGIVFATPMTVVAIALVDSLYVRTALRSQ